MTEQGRANGHWTFDVSMSLNFGGDGPAVNVRMLVQIPDEITDDGIHEVAAQRAKDLLRPFLRGDVHFGDHYPVIVEVGR